MHKLLKIWYKLRYDYYHIELGKLSVSISIKKPYAGIRFEMDFSTKSCFELDIYFGIYYYVTIYLYWDRKPKKD